MTTLVPVFRPMPVLAALLLIAGCAAPEPVLYPNDHLAYVGRDAAEEDIDDCQDMAESAGANKGEGSGEQAGSAGRGAAVGAAAGAAGGLVRGRFKGPKPSSAYRNFVNRCLYDRGYEVVGWD
jgi:hypothetical protein